MSDEEAERMSSTYILTSCCAVNSCLVERDISDVSLELSQPSSSQAAVYDSLRARLSGATLAPGHASTSHGKLECSMGALQLLTTQFFSVIGRP